MKLVSTLLLSVFSQKAASSYLPLCGNATSGLCHNGGVCKNKETAPNRVRREVDQISCDLNTCLNGGECTNVRDNVEHSRIRRSEKDWFCGIDNTKSGSRVISCPDNVPHGYYCDMNNPSAYCYCSGKAVIPSNYAVCVSGLHWDPVNQVCNWPSSVNKSKCPGEGVC